MRKLIVPLLLTIAVGFFFMSKKGKTIKNTVRTYVSTASLINESGRTVSDRLIVPEGFSRAQYAEGTFQKYLQNYALKEYGAKVINYDGNPYIYQAGHVGILEIPVPKNGLQQCADALIRIRAEYLWEKDRKDEIAFSFTSGHRCSWEAYSKGFRPRIDGNKVSFHRTARPNTTKENFYNYLNLVYTYAGTLSLHAELPEVNQVDDIQVGDMLIYPGSPGHVIMVVDLATNDKGEKLFIFAQGNTPAQSVHIIKNPNDLDLSPWYEIEMGVYLEIPTYAFDEVKFMRFKE